MAYPYNNRGSWQFGEPDRFWVASPEEYAMTTTCAPVRIYSGPAEACEALATFLDSTFPDSTFERAKLGDDEQVVIRDGRSSRIDIAHRVATGFTAGWYAGRLVELSSITRRRA